MVLKRRPNSPLPILRDLHPSPYVALAMTRLAAPIALPNVDRREITQLYEWFCVTCILSVFQTYYGEGGRGEVSEGEREGLPKSLPFIL